VLAQARFVYGVLGDRERGRRFTASLALPYRISRNHSLVLEGQVADTPDVCTDTFRLSWHFYF
jgi:hypothetical protein